MEKQINREPSILLALDLAAIQPWLERMPYNIAVIENNKNSLK